MNTFKLLAFDQVSAKPGCKYTEFSTVGPESYGWVAGSNEKCGASYYARQPYIYAPTILVIVAVIGFVFIKLHKKSK